jgi:hypothetical protein
MPHSLTLRLPAHLANCPIMLRYQRLLLPLDWPQFPERDTHRPWPGPSPTPRAPFVAAYLVKLNEHLHSMADLRRFLTEHPALAWLIGFPLNTEGQPILPSPRQFGRVLRTLDNECLQFLLSASIQLFADNLPPGMPLGDVISLDTKHILAWVRENNPKEHIRDRFLKERHPKGDPDCRLGCKERRNRPPDTSLTPTTNPVPAAHLTVGQFYWGYASGVVATRLPSGADVVLAELTQPFDQNDITYFFPLMQQVEQRLSRRPRCGALDAAYDAFYIYDYFHQAGGFAAVPLTGRGRHKQRSFTATGAPFCPASLPMKLKYTFLNRKSFFPHPYQRYRCPLSDAAACPIHHAQAAKGGCTATLAASPGSRLRYQIDRQADTFKDVYKQRTATERINSQAVALGIERPRLRNQRSITNMNTLIYILINLRTWQRMQEAAAADMEASPMSRC